MCDYCSRVQLIENITTPTEYEKTFDYIKELVHTEKYLLVDGNCELGMPKDENGCWVNDCIFHTIKCPKCGQEFTCTVNTYKGNGSFRKGQLNSNLPNGESPMKKRPSLKNIIIILLIILAVWGLYCFIHFAIAAAT